MITKAQLEAELTLLRKQLDHLLVLIGAVGLPSEPWMSPEQVGRVLGVSANSIRERIKQAEERRLVRKPCECVYGQHYRNDADPESSTPTWKVNLLAWNQLLKEIPPEKRTV